MTVYAKDNVKWLKQAIDSILDQTYQPNEFLIVKDGPLTEQLDAVISEYSDKESDLIRVEALPQNVGLGAALNYGVTHCQYEYIARMDADDISAPERCETILTYMQKNPDVSIVGCNADEFSGDIQNVVAHVILPQTAETAYRFAKKRVPIRHPSIIFKKRDILQVGNYKSLKRSQEYDLVVRILMAGKKVSNVPQVLFYIRVDDNFYTRRGGLSKAKMLASQRYDFYKYGYYSFPEFLFYASINISVCLMPNVLRKLLYQRVLRK